MSNAVTKPLPSSNTSQIAYDPDTSAWQKEGPAGLWGVNFVYFSLTGFFFTHTMWHSIKIMRKSKSVTDGPEKKI